MAGNGFRLPASFVNDPERLLRPYHAAVRAARGMRREARAAAAAALLPPVPAPPPLPPGPPAPAAPGAPIAAPAVPQADVAPLPDDHPDVRRERMAVARTRVAARKGANVSFIRPRRNPDRALRRKLQNIIDTPRAPPNTPEDPPQPPPATPEGRREEPGVIVNIRVNQEAPVDEARNYTVLLNVMTTSACTFHGAAGAELRVKLQVYKNNEPDFRTYLGYYAFIKLRRPGEENFETIGNIASWRFSRPTARDPHLDRSLWVREWLEGEVNDTKYINSTSCIAEALRAIYDDDGDVRERVEPEFEDELQSNGTGNELVYIQQLYVKLSNEDGTIRYNGNNYARQALDMYYRLMTGGILPSWYTLGGPVTFILEPGLLNSEEMARTWEESRRPHETDAGLALRVSRTLARFYERSGYRVYADVTTDLDHGFTTMGRAVAPGEFPRRGADDQVVGGWRDGAWWVAPGQGRQDPAADEPPPSPGVSPTPSRPEPGAQDGGDGDRDTPTRAGPSGGA